MSLTAEDRRSLAYFILEKQDPTRWTGWEAKKEAIALELPALMFAWLNYQQAERVLFEMARELDQ